VYCDTQSVLVADLDGDGDQDVAAAQIVSGTVKVQVFLNSGLGQFLLGPLLETGVLVLAADLDGDGQVDLIGRQQDQWQLLRGLGNSQFSNPELLVAALNSAQPGDKPMLLDFDGDGDLDLIIQVGTRLSLLRQQPGGTFAIESQTLAVDPLTGQAISLENHPNLERHWAIGDLDGNGIDDLIAGPLDECVDGSHVLLFDGQGNFSVRQQILRASLLDDLDGDGDLDSLGPKIHQNRRIPNPGAGERQQYGSSGPLACSARPILGAAGPFRVGGSSLLTVSGVAPGSFGIFTVGLAQSAFPDFPWVGVTAWAWPLAGYLFLPPPTGPGVAPGDGLTSLQFTIQPNWPNFGPLYHQAFFIDACSPSLVTGSNGLMIRYAP
jgi:FG-GAP-like repeat